jgi:hypothetical protein
MAQAARCTTKRRRTMRKMAMVLVVLAIVGMYTTASAEQLAKQLSYVYLQSPIFIQQQDGIYAVTCIPAKNINYGQNWIHVYPDNNVVKGVFGETYIMMSAFNIKAIVPQASDCFCPQPLLVEKLTKKK